MNAREHRRFRVMLGLSALLHGALLAMVAGPRPPSQQPTLVASIRLIDASPAAPAAAPAAISPKARQEEPRIERTVPPRPGRIARPATASLPAPAAGPVDAPVSEPLPAPASAAPVAVAAGETTRPAAPSAPAQSDMLASYRQRLTELFARGYEYPRIAALRGWEGEVRLRLKVARKGNLLGVHLDRSSGFAVLDQHALALLEGHGNLPPFPEALEGSEIQVIVPINYKLRKTT